MLKKALFFQAHAKLSKIVSLLEANKDMLMKNHVDYYTTRNVEVYEKLAELEVRRRNFQAVISIHDFCDSIDGDFGVMTDKLYVLYCLALMVTGKKDSYQATEAALKYTHFIYSNENRSDPNYPQLHPDKAHLASLGSSKQYLYSNRESLAILGLYWHMFLVELHRMRKWDEALDLTNQFGGYIEEATSFASEFMQAATYIERYRVEARKRPKDERNKMSVSLYKYITAKITDGTEKAQIKAQTGDSCVLLYITLIFAQWNYLNHQGTKEQRAEEKESSITLVEKYIEANCELKAMHLCLGCISSETKLVCSGCRVACYCCIDHQRSSWRKELEMGVGIGHKILCPLYKAYHKYHNARRSHGKNIHEYYLRFRRECEKFLSDGLGLRDLCFSQDFVDKNHETFKSAKSRKVYSEERLTLLRQNLRFE